jgi:uncharacterized protein (DUF1697 family)
VLLRGINLGPHNRISMPDLRGALAAEGFGEPQTYLQSGNLVLSSEQSPEALAEVVERLISARFGLSIPVVVRTRDELGEVIAKDPFSAAKFDEKRYQVTFLANHPPDGLAAEVSALAQGEERFVADGREWYVYHPAGVARSKLATRIAGRNLGVLATARNWTTVCNLLELADGR